MLQSAKARAVEVRAGDEQPARQAWSDGLVKPWSLAGWRATVLEFLDVLQAQLDKVADGHPSRPYIEARMRCAHATAKARSTPATWYSGSKVDVVWRELHLAEVELCRILPDTDLAGMLPRYRARAADELGEHSEQVQELTGVADEVRAARTTARITRRQRAIIAGAVAGTNERTATEHAALRHLRNRLMQFGLVLLVLNLVIAIATSLNPELMPLCVVKDGDVSVCPTGNGGSVGIDVWWLQLFGALGGAIGIVSLIHHTPAGAVAYPLYPHQGMIKILLGAVLAMLGVLVLGSSTVKLSISSQAELLIFATVLGYSQQVGTKLLDSYANKVLTAAKPPGATSFP